LPFRRVSTSASLLQSVALENLLAALDAEESTTAAWWAVGLVVLGVVFVMASVQSEALGIDAGMRVRCCSGLQPEVAAVRVKVERASVARPWQLVLLAAPSPPQSQSALTAAIHAKLLRVPSGVSKGTVSTLVGSDTGKFSDLGIDFHFIWAAPLCLFVALGLCWRLLGAAILPAVAVAVVLIPVNGAITSAFTETEEAVLRHQQRRMASVSEAVSSILGVKLFGWEGRVARRVAHHRVRELRHVRRYALAIAAVMSVITSMSTLMACAAFATFAVMGGTLSSSVVFPALYLLQLTTWPLLQIPYVIGQLASASASLGRIRRFLLGREVAAADRAGAGDAPAPRPPAGEAGTTTPSSEDAIVLRDVTLRWPKPSRVSQKSSKGAGASRRRWCTGGGSSTAEHPAETATVPLLGADGGVGAPTVRKHRVQSPVLHGLTLRVPRGQLVAVVGPVGSGKSSLLSAVLGELEPEAATARGDGAHATGAPGRVAFVPQSSWVRSVSVRENVDLAAAGGPSDGPSAARGYDDVVSACCLEPDFEQLAQGDATEVGESGVSLSGGQRARVTLARAVRSGAEVFLLDDPLSAVDAHVGARLFHDVVCGALAGTTRVLVTHQLQFLPLVDRILVMRGGRVAHDGSYEELTAAGVRFASLLEQAEAGGDGSDGHGSDGDAVRPLRAPRPAPREASAGRSFMPSSPQMSPLASSGMAMCSAAGAAAGAAGSLVRNASVGSVPGVARPVGAAGGAPAADGSDPAGLMTDEDRATGTVGYGVYVAYAASLGGACFAVWFVILSLTLELMASGSGAFLALWADAADGKAVAPPPFASSLNPPASYWVSGYLAMGLVGTAASLARNFTWFEATFRASRRLHDRVMASLLRAPLSFWTSTPSGRILNRLSKDVSVVDQQLPDYTSDVLLCVVECASRLLTIAVASPVFLVVFLPVVAFYWVVLRFYRASSRELKRLEAIAGSPLQTRFAEAVDGLVSIRAYGLQAAERAAALVALDASNTAQRASRFANRWISLRVELSGSVIVAAVSAIAVLATVPAVQPYIPGVRSLLALALTYSINLTGTFNWFVRCVTSAEAEFSRVERLYAFASILPEGPMEGTGPPVPTSATRGPGGAAKSDGWSADGDDAGPSSLSLDPPAPVTVARVSSAGTQASDALVGAAAGRLAGVAPDQWAGTEEHRRQTRPEGDLCSVPRGWPERGDVRLEGVWMRYRPDLDPVLRGISVSIPAGTRVGIVGRTGAGKSSLFAALFRTVELCKGRILVDGADTSDVGVRDLRRSIAAVPQEPVLWSGTLRAALDPSGPDEVIAGRAAAPVPKRRRSSDESSDEDDGDDGAGPKGTDEEREEEEEDDEPAGLITRLVCGDHTRPVTDAEIRSGMRWDPARGMPLAPRPSDAAMLAALDAVGLGPWAEGFSLDGRVDDGGKNLSLGTRQLLALARTLLRGCRVVALDEATASVSPAEDNAIQAALRTAFRGRTVLTVAHRLPTVIEYDRILVLDAGAVVEYGSPAQLLGVPGADGAPGAEPRCRTTGAFAGLVRETGPRSEAALRAAAARFAGLRGHGDE